MIKKKNNNIVKFSRTISKIERQVEAILFAASEPLDIETIEKRIQSSSNIKKILESWWNEAIKIFKLVTRVKIPKVICIKIIKI